MRQLANRCGRLLSLLALLGVLLHAQALVRHVLLAAAHSVSVENAALIADLGVICHAPADAEAIDAPSSTPGSPASPKDKVSSCPVCAGLLSLHALQPPTLDISFQQCRSAPVRIASAQNGKVLPRYLRPPGRGPPTVTSI